MPSAMLNDVMLNELNLVSTFQASLDEGSPIFLRAAKCRTLCLADVLSGIFTTTLEGHYLPSTEKENKTQKILMITQF